MTTGKLHGFSARRLLLLALLLVIAALLLSRATYLQLINKDFLQEEGAARHLRVVTVAAHRGMITDRNGEPLAVSTPVDSVWVNPKELIAERSSWPRLAKLLDIKISHLERLLAVRRDKEFVYVRRHVPPELAARVMDLNIPGVSLQREYKRYYPDGEVAAHVVGFTNVDDVGQEGIELGYDDSLRSQPGAKRVIRDRLGRVIEDVENIRQAKPGRDLALSIDRRLQYLAYRELMAGGG